MKCVISAGNIKLLAKAIQMLAKIGDEVFVMPQEDCLSLRIVNGANSAFGDITLFENFFSYYAYGDLEDNDALKCKILIKSALAVFKTPSLLDKQVESCHIQLDPDAEHLHIILKYRNGIIKTHLLPILDSETLKANYKKDGTPNHLCIQPRVMNDVIQNFQQNLLEITIEALQEKVLIRNYIDEISNMPNETRTQLAFGVGEFDEYTIESDTAITFCLKELRAVVHFAEAAAQPINIYFERSGRPVVFVCKTSSLETNVVLATLNPATDTGSQSTVSTRPQPIPKKVPAKRAIKAKGIKSLGKKSFNSTKQMGKVNNNSNNSMDTNTTDIRNTDSPGRISDVSETPSQDSKRNSINNSRTCTTKSNTTKSNVDKNESENNIKRNPFSSFLKRKSEQEISSPSYLDNEDLIQNSPPRQQSKRAKLIFQKCFQSTFDPRSLPGYNDVEVEDSGDSD